LLNPLSYMGSLLILGGVGSLLNWSRKRRSRLRRLARRRLCNLKTWLRTEACTYDGTIVDVSRIGAKIASDGPLKRGDKILMSVRGKMRPVFVRWSNQHYVGVKFAKVLTGGEIRRMLKH
jgi:PilZ domain-containing protein